MHLRPQKDMHLWLQNISIRRHAVLEQPQIFLLAYGHPLYKQRSCPQGHLFRTAAALTTTSFTSFQLAIFRGLRPILSPAASSATTRSLRDTYIPHLPRLDTNQQVRYSTCHLSPGRNLGLLQKQTDRSPCSSFDRS